MVAGPRVARIAALAQFVHLINHFENFQFILSIYYKIVFFLF
jgi:hypothetical protein